MNDLKDRPRIHSIYSEMGFENLLDPEGPYMSGMGIDTERIERYLDGGVGNTVSVLRILKDDDVPRLSQGIMKLKRGRYVVRDRLGWPDEADVNVMKEILGDEYDFYAVEWD
jgi:hypothetical protein